MKQLLQNYTVTFTCDDNDDVYLGGGGGYDAVSVETDVSREGRLSQKTSLETSGN